MLNLVLIYGLCALTGGCIERRLALDSLLKRVVMVFVIGAGQWMVSVQLLSLGNRLTGWWLLAANLLFTGIICGALSTRQPPEGRASWLALLRCAWGEIGTLRRHPAVLALVVVALGVAVAGCAVGLAMAPYGDSYHVEMPLFWIQHQTILPFPVHNPRIVSLSFLSEALSLPGFLYARCGWMPALLMLLGWLLSLWVVVALSRRLGASLPAAAAAAAIISGYSLLATEALTAIPSGFLAAAWFGASLLFLMDARDLLNGRRTTELGCSMFSFVMACGAKNTTTLLAPLYVMALLLTVLRPGARALRARVGLVLVLCGLAGLVCSGVAWNYASNKLWFGSSRGPTAISETVSRDYHPQAVWTRLCRGGVLVAYDTVWLPKSARGAYATLCEKTVSVLGGRRELAEDDSYYSFQAETLTPRKGLGLLGVVFFLPAVGLAAGRCWLARKLMPARYNTALLVIMTVGSFVLCHLVLRWQGIGVLRLMYPFVVAGAPLASLLLEKPWRRGLALALLLLSAAMFSTLWLGNVARKQGWNGRGAFAWVARLQNNHVLPVQCQWTDQPARELVMQEDYSYRELYEEFLAGIIQPATIGLIGPMNTECNFLFGQQFQNRVMPLVDSRTSPRIMELPEDMDYVVIADGFAEADRWAEAHGFHRVLTIANAGKEMLAAFERPREKIIPVAALRR